jgi:putative glutamine amidotransferase
MSHSPVIAVAWPKEDYVSALEQAGAIVRILSPAHDSVSEALDRCDGVLLTGGEDVDPAHYGEDQHPTTKPDPARDEYEMVLARLALERNVPLLGICRGAQLLNVAAGGTLIQDLPSQRPGPVPHAVRQTPDTLAHDVTIQPETCLAMLLHGEAPDGRVTVNSRHHQAVNAVAPGFVVSATAPDGVVEAIEKPSAPFCVAVQWHPENFWRSGRFRSLFDGLIDAARKRRAR